MNEIAMGNCQRKFRKKNRDTCTKLNKGVPALDFYWDNPNPNISSSEISFFKDKHLGINTPPHDAENVFVVDDSSSSISERTWASFNIRNENHRRPISNSGGDIPTPDGNMASQNPSGVEYTVSIRTVSSNPWSVYTEKLELTEFYPSKKSPTPSLSASLYNYEPVERRFESRKRRSLRTEKLPSVLENSSRRKSCSTMVSHASYENDKFLRDRMMNCSLFIGFHSDDIDVKVIDKLLKEMYPQDLKGGEILVKQGAVGKAFFLVQYGLLEVLVSKKKKSVSTMVAIIKPGQTVGEGALLYSTKRRATLRARGPTRVWVMEVGLFKRIRNLLKYLEKKNFTSRLKFLSSIPLFSNMKPHSLHNLAQAFREEHFALGESIGGDTDNDFYIIKEGKALMVRRRKRSIAICRSEEFHAGDFFMRRKLKNETRCSVTAISNVNCLKISGDDIDLLVSPYINLKYSNVEYSKSANDSVSNWEESVAEVELPKYFKNRVPWKLDDFEPVAVAGSGNFGHVVLVKVKGCEDKVYALKLLEKNMVINTGQMHNVQNERRVMFMMDSPFIIKLYATYHDETCVYFLLEKAMGGELFALLRRKKFFREAIARFYIGCVVLALEHIHSHMILYRDLKPENVLISSNGYVKVTDFGFAKKRNQSTSLCGTPEYMAPEVVTGGIQNFGVDWWCAGIFLYEMLVGHVPFKDSEHMKMYEDIIESTPKLPKRVSLEAQKLTHGLLRKNSFRRLGSGPEGAGDIKKQSWFQKMFVKDPEPFVWDKLSAFKLTAPYKPKLSSDHDSRYFSAPKAKKETTKLCRKFDHSLYKWCEEF